MFLFCFSGFLFYFMFSMLQDSSFTHHTQSCVQSALSLTPRSSKGVGLPRTLWGPHRHRFQSNPELTRRQSMEGGRTRAEATPRGIRAVPGASVGALGGKGRVHRGQEGTAGTSQHVTGAGEGGPVPNVWMKAPAPGRQGPAAGGSRVFPRGAWGHGGDALF